MKRFGFILMISSLLFCVSCMSFEESATQNVSAKTSQLSAWVVDWDYEKSYTEAVQMNQLSSIQLFGLYFDHKNKFYETEDFKHLKKRAFEDQTQQVSLYLTVINDRFLPNGEAVQKDSAIVSTIVKTKKTRMAYIQQLVDMAVEQNYAGIEIDFEKVKDSDSHKLKLFYRDLYKKLQEHNKALRIVLEPSTISKQKDYVKGPEYVIMAYNLYGYHSGPGPKADYEFIEKLMKDSNHIPGKVTVAFATGGFDWSQGEITGITEQEAINRTGKHKVTRDAKSGALHFTYKDEYNNKHEIWYADEETLKGWMLHAKQLEAVNIAIWRTGGLSESTLKNITK